MSNIKISALGGMGENGKNMYLIEVDERIFVLDAGLIYPKIDLYGIDAVVPNIDYLIENQNRIEGVFISHGHVDHIGALPYLLKNIRTRVYATPFTVSLIEAHLKDDGINLKNCKLIKVNTNKVLKFGNIKVNFFNVNHALPEAAIITIETQDGLIVYATDFNFSRSLNEKYKIDYEKLLELSKNKVLAVMAESVGIQDVNRATNSEKFEAEIFNCLSKTHNNVFIATYSTDVSRIQQIIKIAEALDKKVAFFNRKGEQIVTTALKTKYLEIKDDTLVDLDTINKQDLVVFICGNHTDPYYLISRIINNNYKNIKITKDDLIIGLSDAVSGTEKYVIKSLDEIYKYDLKFKSIDNKMLRTSHATASDLTQLYDISKPTYYIPIKGEMRHLAKHLALLDDLNIDKEKIKDLQDGNVLHFENGLYQKTTQRPLKEIFVDGSLTGAVNENIVNERYALANNGIIEIVLYIDSKKKNIVKDATIITKGFVYEKLDEDKLEQIHTIIDRLTKTYFNKKLFVIDDLQNAITNEVNKIIYRLIKAHATIIPVVIDLKNANYK